MLIWMVKSSGLPKAEGLRPKSKVSHLRLPLRLPKVYAAEGQRSSRRLKHLKFSKFKCKFCDKNFRIIKVHVCSVFKRFENLYYIISIWAFQNPMSKYAHQILKYNIPNLWLHLWLRLQGPKFFHLCLRLRLRPMKSPLVDHCYY